jgi:hypothetical protein
MAEVRIMESKLNSLGMPDHLYADCVNSLRTAFSPTQISVPWSGHKEKIEKLATPLALQWAGWALNQFNENEIDAGSLQELLQSLKTQEDLLASADLPIGLREILERQKKALRRAIQLYRITGAEPISKVVTDAYGELITAPTTLAAEVEQAAPSAKDALQKGMQLIGKTAEIADKGSKVIKFGEKLYELGKAGYQIGYTLLQNAPSSTV